MRTDCLLLASLALAASASAQHDLGSRLQPITAPLRRAGVYHVATGTWTREGSLANLVGPDIIYNNSCSLVYFEEQTSGEKFQHRSRLPTTARDYAPATPSVFYGLPRFDEAPGCLTSYAINGFEIAYCSSSTTPINYVHEFTSYYGDCADADMIPTYSFALTGLPGGQGTGLQNCWIIQVDTSATTPEFVLSADGDGTYDFGFSAENQFGWSFGPVGLVGSSTGPIVAGNYTWTGGAVDPPPVPCTGTDGTIWDSPINLTEDGTGMSSNDFFRITGATTAPSGPGCYSFGTVHSDFYLKLYASTGCAVPSPMTLFCYPGHDGVVPCPCDNPPPASGMGCNNFGAGPAQSPTLSATGSPSIANDTAVLHASGQNAGSNTIFLQGPSSSSTGVVFGAGVRCIAGSLKRLYTGVHHLSISRPVGSDPDIHTRSAALGDPLSAGTTRFYMTFYRDPNAAGNCTDGGASMRTFNCSNSGKMTWGP